MGPISNSLMVRDIVVDASKDFKSVEDLRDWYHSSLEGISRSIVTFALEVGTDEVHRHPGFTAARMSIGGINRTYVRAYRTPNWN